MPENETSPKELAPFEIDRIITVKKGNPQDYLTTGRSANGESFTIRIQPDQTYTPGELDTLEVVVKATLGNKDSDLLASYGGKGDGDKVIPGKGKKGRNAWDAFPNQEADKVTWTIKPNENLELTAGKPCDLATFSDFTYSPTTGTAKLECTLTYNDTEKKTLGFVKQEPVRGQPSVEKFDVTPFPALANTKVKITWKVAGLVTPLVAPQRLYLEAPHWKRDIQPKPDEGYCEEYYIPGVGPVEVQLIYEDKATEVLARLRVEAQFPGFEPIEPTDSWDEDQPKLTFHNLIKAGGELYAIAGKPGGTARVYRCGSHPRYWTPELNDADRPLPQAFASSPAVWFDGKIWLVGGSSYDMGRVSNEVWVGEKSKSGKWLFRF